VPLDRAIDLLPGNGTGARPAARLAVDRVDATVRAVIATILGDAVLREDAEQRRSAAEESGYALRLRVEAERKAAQADTELDERQERATQQRERANEHAKVRLQEADRRREKEKLRAAKAESERLEASRRTAKLGEKVLSDRAPKERLQTLSAEIDALRQKDKELAARSEAQSLREAASRTKADRKTG
jgi:colicin import membrane protein